MKMKLQLIKLEMITVIRRTFIALKRKKKIRKSGSLKSIA